MKETNLGKYYVQILNIAETSADAKRLLHWRKPTADTVRTQIKGREERNKANGRWKIAKKEIYEKEKGMSN